MLLSLFLYSFRENKFVYSNKLLPFNIKSIYNKIIESYACILKIFV